jgi:thiol:disulfide interchange protein DsbD
MIPITVSVVGGLGPARKTWRELCVRGVAYVLGMTVIYSFLGIIAGLSGRVFGSLTNTSQGYLCIGLIMTAASLWMLEVIQFDPFVAWDSWKRKWLTNARPQSPASRPEIHTDMGWAGAFTLGASSGFIAAPCTTPVLTSILAYIAKTQSVGVGFLLMMSFSLGLGTILLGISVFAGALQLLPKSGQWMKHVKIGSGLILLAFAEFLIYRAGNSGGP